MKIANEKILQYVDALARCNSVTGLPGMVIAITRRKMSEEIVEYVKEKQRIFEKYGRKQDNGWIIPKDSPDFKKAMEEITQIATYQTDVDVPQFYEKEFIQKFQSDALTAENYDILYEIFVREENEYAAAENNAKSGNEWVPAGH